MDAHRVAALIDRHGPPLILYARQWCDAPEDIVQEAFLKLLTAKPPRQVVPWLYRVVRNAALDTRKLAERRQRREQTAAQSTNWFVEPEIDGLDAEVAVAALERLPDEQREVIVARLWGGLSFEEIGEVVGCATSSAFRRFESGIASLRHTLGEPCRNRTSTN